MRFTITTALFVLLVSTVSASPLPIDSSLEGRNVPAARSAAESVERRAEPANLEIRNRKRQDNPDWKRADDGFPNADWKRKEDWNSDWKRNVGVASPLS